MPVPLEITLQDLRAMIQGLKMAGLGFVDQEALGDIEDRIQLLPSPEAINKIADSPNEIKKIQEEVGNILRLIEIYSRRDPEFKARYKSRTGLPPRYKVLEWRSMMNQKSRNIIKSMVKVSEIADSRGKYVIAKDLIKCAKKIQNETINEKEFLDVIEKVKASGLGKDTDLVKEAQMWQQFKGFMGGLGEGVGNVFQNIWQSGKAGGLEAKFKGIAQNMQSILVELKNLSNQAQQSGNAKVQQRMTHLYQIVDGAAKGWNQVIDQGKQIEQQSEAEPQAQEQAAQPAQVPNKQEAVQYLQGLMGQEGLDNYQQRAIQNVIDSLNR